MRGRGVEMKGKGVFEGGREEGFMLLRMRIGKRDMDGKGGGEGRTGEGKDWFQALRGERRLVDGPWVYSE